MLPFCMISPERTKKGTASRGKESRESTSFCIKNSAGKSPTITATTTLEPMATPMGTLKMRRVTSVIAARVIGHSIATAPATLEACLRKADERI